MQNFSKTKSNFHLGYRPKKKTVATRRVFLSELSMNSVDDLKNTQQFIHRFLLMLGGRNICTTECERGEKNRGRRGKCWLVVRMLVCPCVDIFFSLLAQCRGFFTFKRLKVAQIWLHGTAMCRHNAMERRETRNEKFQSCSLVSLVMAPFFCTANSFFHSNIYIISSVSPRTRLPPGCTWG